MKSLLTKTIGIFLFAALMLFMTATEAQASHFRGGNMHYTLAPNGVATFTVESLWRKYAYDGFHNISIRNAAGAQVLYQSVSYTGTTVLLDTSNPDYDFRRQVFTVNMAGLPAGQYTAFHSNCCRISGIRNPISSNFSFDNKIIYTPGAANGSPQLNASFITTVARGYNYSQNLNAFDPDGHSMSYQLLSGGVAYSPTSNIPGLTISPTGQVNIPAANTATLTTGNWVFKVRVTDSSGAFSDRDVMVNVVNTSNVPPVVGSIGDRIVALGQSVSFPVSATDTNAGDTVTLSSSSLPAGASFIQTPGNPASGTFTWTPSAGQEGVHTINFEAKDNGIPNLTASQQVKITVVGANNAPILDPVGSKSVPAGGKLSFHVTCSDPADPGDSQTLSASFMPAGATLTQNTFGNSVSGTFAWTPSYSQANQVFTGIAIRCTDNGLPNLTDEESINITVGNANNAPALASIGNQSVGYGQSMTLNLSASDADGNVVTLSSSSLPPNATFVQNPGNPASGTFTFTPDFSQAGMLVPMTFTATDNGNPNLFSSESIVIIVLSNQPPVANAGGTYIAQCSGNSSASVTLNGSGSTDPDAGDTLSYAWSWPGGSATGSNPTASFPLGHTLVNLTVSDGNGGESTAYATVIVEDTTAPTVNAGPDVTVEATGQDGAAYDVSAQASATDNCCAVSISISPVGIYPLGENLVNVSATDCSNNTGYDPMIVNIVDTTAPVLTVPANVTVEANGVLSTVTLAAATATDIFSVTITNDAPALFAFGDTTVTWMATDPNGNSSTATQTVTVADTTAPVLTVPADVSVEANGVLSTVSLGTATATDIFGATVTNDAPATFALGATTVTYTATDGNGLTTSGTQTVTVADTTAPVLNVPADITAEANAINSTVAIGSATATDIFPVTVTSDAPATYLLGTTVVTWTATDANGNVTTGTQNVTVVDTTAPVLTVPADVSVEATGMETPVSIGTATATDIFAVTVTSDAPATYPLGTTVVTWTATDANGNVTTGTQNVTVVDTTAPTVTAQLVPVVVSDDDDHHGKNEEHAKKGLFQVVFTASDIVDANPALTATLNGATVTNGQIVQLKQSKKAEVEFEHGKLQVEGMSFTLDVSATDFSGNTGTASASYAFPVHEDHGIHRGNDKEDKHADSGNHKSEGKAKVEHKDSKKSDSKKDKKRS